MNALLRKASIPLLGLVGMLLQILAGVVFIAGTASCARTSGGYLIVESFIDTMGDSSQSNDEMRARILVCITIAAQNSMNTRGRPSQLSPNMAGEMQSLPCATLLPVDA